MRCVLDGDATMAVIFSSWFLWTAGCLDLCHVLQGCPVLEKVGETFALVLGIQIQIDGISGSLRSASLEMLLDSTSQINESLGLSLADSCSR